MPDRQFALPVEVVAHPVHIGLAGADAGRDRFEPAVPLQSGDDPFDPPGVTACPATDAYSRARHRLRMKVVFLPGRISSQTVRIRGAPSDSTTTSSAANTPYRCANCSRRAANSEARPAPRDGRAQLPHPARRSLDRRAERRLHRRIRKLQTGRGPDARTTKGIRSPRRRSEEHVPKSWQVGLRESRSCQGKLAFLRREVRPKESPHGKYLAELPFIVPKTSLLQMLPITENHAFTQNAKEFSRRPAFYRCDSVSTVFASDNASFHPERVANLYNLQNQ